jgi:hypothetical protein
MSAGVRARTAATLERIIMAVLAAQQVVSVGWAMSERSWLMAVMLLA